MDSAAHTPERRERPWGEELWFTDRSEAPSMVKILAIAPHQALSLQQHARRDEYWFVIEGAGSAQIGDDTIPLQKGSSQFVPRDTKHRLQTDAEGLRILELAFGDFDQEDIIRFEDRYGRAN